MSQGGGLMQLVSYGAADIYLTGNPSITYFKMVYHRHTNFAMELITQEFQVQPTLTTTQEIKATVRVERAADLVHDSYLVFDLPDIYSNKEINFQWIRDIGNNIYNRISAHIGNQKIDTQYSRWADAWNQLSLPIGKRRAYSKLVGGAEAGGDLRPEVYALDDAHLAIPARRLYIPLDFWFCRNAGLSIPLIALQYVEVFLNVEFRALNDLFTIGSPPLSPTTFFSESNNTGDNLILKKKLEAEGYDANTIFWRFVNGTRRPGVWGQRTYMDMNYIYLDTPERRKYALITHEYLIPQVQRRLFTGVDTENPAFELMFQHPVKELMWMLQRDDVARTNDWNNYTTMLDADDYQKVLRRSQELFDEIDFPPDEEFRNSVDIQEFLKRVREVSDTGLPAELCNNQSVRFEEWTNIMRAAHVRINGNPRFEERDHYYFTTLVPYKYHSSLPNRLGINVYSFALHPEKDQPSGTMNFSRLNRDELVLNLKRPPTGTTFNLYVFGYGYNILTIMGGMAGLKFAN